MLYFFINKSFVTSGKYRYRHFLILKSKLYPRTHVKYAINVIMQQSIVFNSISRNTRT